MWDVGLRSAISDLHSGLRTRSGAGHRSVHRGRHYRVVGRAARLVGVGVGVGVLVVLGLGGLQGVLEEEGGGDWSDASGYWGQCAGVSLDAGGVHVAEQTAVVSRCGADVDNNGTLSDVLRRDEAGNSCCGDHDLGGAGVRGEVGRLPMANGDGRVGAGEQVRGGDSHDGRSAHDGHVLAG
jgi:hypothetical protein